MARCQLSPGQCWGAGKHHVVQLRTFQYCLKLMSKQCNQITPHNTPPLALEILATLVFLLFSTTPNRFLPQDLCTAVPPGHITTADSVSLPVKWGWSHRRGGDSLRCYSGNRPPKEVFVPAWQLRAEAEDQSCHIKYRPPTLKEETL